ncbi:MAG: BON domain-containing protein [Planctomycetaceae bacterium]|nr:BON domain-containing protein [Planctomycetaceae bacterium]
MHPLRHLAVLLLTVAFTPALAWAQGAGGTSGGQSSSSSSTGSAASSAASQSSSVFGGSSTGTGSTGGGAAGSGGGIAQPQFNQFGQAAANIGTGFVGRGNNQQSFVGAQGAGQQSVDAGGTARFSGLGGGGGQGAPANVSQARGGQMRIQQRVAFDSPNIATATVTTNLQTQFASLQAQLPAVNVITPEPGHVVLQGVVASEHQRKLAEAVARLEVGVRKVTNELQVGSASAPMMLPRLTR